MLYYVIQETIPPREKSLYRNGGSVVIPKTVLIPQWEEIEIVIRGKKEILKIFPLRNKTRPQLFSESSGYSYFNFPKGQNPPGVSFNWGDYTDAGVIDTGKVHFSASRSNEGVWGLIVPPEIVVNWGLTEGDQVGVVADPKKHLVLICSVNGQQTPAVTRTRPDITVLKTDSPRQPLPVEMFGDFDLRCCMLLAPVGLGQSYWVVGAGGSGKTWIKVKLTRAIIRLLKTFPDLRIIIAYIGDRPGDATQFEDLVQSANDDRVEFFQSPWSDLAEFEVSTGLFAINRSRALASQGFHTVLIMDSITRLVAADSDSTEAKALIKSGINRESIGRIIQKGVGIYGYYPQLDSSLTVIGTALWSNEKDISKDSSEFVVFQETGQSSTTGTLVLLKNPTLEFPRVNVDASLTFTRYPEGRDFRSPDQIREMETVKRLMWQPVEMRTGDDRYRRAEIAHERLLEYCHNHPTPEY